MHGWQPLLLALGHTVSAQQAAEMDKHCQALQLPSESPLWTPCHFKPSKAC